MNTQALEQAARQAAQEKAAESAKARQAEETLRLQQLSESLNKKKVEGKKDQESSGSKGFRNARYLKDGSVQPDGTETPDDTPPSASSGGIDIRA